MWAIYTLAYSLIKGARDLIKKKALQQSSANEVLLSYTAASFLFVLPDAPQALTGDLSALPLIALKAFILFIAYLCAFRAIQKLPISLYGVVDLSRMMFSILLGVVFLHEAMGIWQIIGAVLVAAGILLLKLPRKQQDLQTEHHRVFIFLAFLQSFLNACSGVLDKIICRTMEAGRVQFWFLLFLSALYVLYVICIRLKVNWKALFKNYWIWLISILFVIADRLLFHANAAEESQLVLITLLKRSGCIVTILGGSLFFKEKGVAFKLLCAGIILTGILLALLL